MNVDNDTSITPVHQNSNFYVRVKRNRDHYPIEQICIIEDVSSAPLKKQRSLDILVSQLSGLSSSTTVLNKDDNNKEILTEPKRLILKRIRTFNDADQLRDIKNALLNPDYHNEAINKPDMTHGTNYGHKDMKLLVTNSIKTIISNADESEQSIAIIDMQQIKRNNTVDDMVNTLPTISSLSATNHLSPLVITPTRILDPATRLLDKGITLAVKTGDFNQISSALIQGADANYQTSQDSGGYTALMVASMNVNVRMVKRLLQKAVDVLRVNATGNNAYELLSLKKKTTTIGGIGGGSTSGITVRNQQEVTEIQQLLLVAMRKAEEMRNHVLLTNKANEHQRRRLLVGEGVVSDDSDMNNTNHTYVYDIYHCVNNSTTATTSAHTLMEPLLLPKNEEEVLCDNNNSEARVINSSSSSSSSREEKMILEEQVVAPYDIIPEVKVEGLKILKDDCNIDIECLVACYDSDWSDLGDDEDPDSNDERYYGNDYPEEEENVVDDDDDEDIDNIQNFQRNIDAKYANSYMNGDGDNEDGDENSDYDINNNSDDENNNNRTYQYTMLHKDKKSCTNSLSNNKQEASLTERRYGVGKVMRPHVRFNDNDESNINHSIYQSHNTESLQKLWGEEHSQSGGSGGDNEDSNRIHSLQYEKTQRIEQMNQRTGMVFGGNPKEFDSSGLPKYAEELSDDDMEIQLNYIQDCSGTFGTTNGRTTATNTASTVNKPSLDTIAYDFELDGED